MNQKVKLIGMILCVVVVLAVIIGVIIAIGRKSNDTPPDEMQSPIADTTEPNNNGTETTIPNIPDKKPDGNGENDQKPVNPDDAVIDILDGYENNERNDEPAIDGEVVIVQGVKGENE